jgi:hypothetical protein
MEEPSMSTTIIPGVLVEPLREGAYAVSRDVAEAIDQGEDLRVCRERLAGVCRLLDEIGWTGDDPSVDTEIDLDAHAATLRPMLAAVVGLMLALMKGWLAEFASDDPARPAREEEYRLMLDLRASVRQVVRRSGTVAIPADVLGELREGLFSLLCDVAGDLDGVFVRPAHKRDRGWVGPVARFDRVRALLDLIGWEQRAPEPDVEVDLCWYGQAVEDALARELDSMRYLAEVDDGHQREWATRHAEVIERFLAGLGGES